MKTPTVPSRDPNGKIYAPRKTNLTNPQMHASSSDSRIKRKTIFQLKARRSQGTGDAAANHGPSGPFEPKRPFLRSSGRRDGGSTTWHANGVMPVSPNASYPRERPRIVGGRFSKDLLPGVSHVTAVEAIQDEFGLRASATTTPGLLKTMFAAIACQKIRVQRILPELDSAQGRKPKPKARR